MKVPHFPFLKYQWHFIAISIVVVVGSLYFLATRGLNYGTDFQGGVKLQYQFPQITTEGEIRSALGALNLGDVSVVRYGAPKERRFVIRVENPATREASVTEVASASSLITPALANAFGSEGLILEQEETVGPKVGQELRRKGLLSVLVSLFLILVYVGFRFDFQFAPGAVIALFHDVIVTVGAFALLGKEFNLSILAAVLTIVGYSLNDTIVIFDRIREHSRLITPETITNVVNQSLNETLSRTIITSLTVFFTVVVLYFFGGGTLKDFAFAMIVGVISGTYSTVFIASPVYIGLYRIWPRLTRLVARPV